MKNNPNIENKFKRIFVLCPEFVCLKKNPNPQAALHCRNFDTSTLKSCPQLFCLLKYF